jgi:hypothetical protein
METAAEKEKKEKMKKIDAKKLAQKEKEEATRKKARFFKGTIVIIVIYAVVILVMSGVGLASESARSILFDDGFTFTVTFISGTILVIIALLVEIFNYKELPKTPIYAGENMSCPDFWILKKTPPNVLDKIQDKKARQLSKYYCENPSISTDIVMKIGTGTDLGSQLATDNTNAALKQLNAVGAVYNAGNGLNEIDANYHMRCNRLYPDYMAHVDKTEFAANPTKMRCEYVKTCEGSLNNTPVSWTSMCNN